MNFWQQLPRPFFALAPMDDVTDVVFRTLVGECASPDVYFTEFVSADGLQSSGRHALIRKLRLDEAKVPTVAQIWGLNPRSYTQTANELGAMGFAGIDINMGCPVKVVLRRGACSGLMHNWPLAHELIVAAKKGAPELPISVKTRIGYNQVDMEWIEFLLRQDIAALTLHGRTVAELSKVPAHWEVIAKAVELRDKFAPGTVIIGNGDVADYADGVAQAKASGVDGIMIGRGIFKDMWAFSPKAHTQSRTENLELLQRHIKLYSAEYGDDRNFAVLKKFFKVYVNGFDGASALRQDLMELESAADALELLNSQLLLSNQN